MSLCSLFRTAAKVSPLISTLLISARHWSSSRYFQRPGTSAISYIQKHKYRSQWFGFFFLTVIDIVNVWVWLTLLIERFEAEWLYILISVKSMTFLGAALMSPFVSLSSVSASMSSRSTQDDSSWQQRRLSWWNYAKAPATHLRIARKHWRSLTMT